MSDRGAELRARYGDPEPMNKLGSNIFVWAHDSHEAAIAFVESNLDDGFEAWVDQKDGRWVSIVDLNPYLNSLPKVV